MRVIYALLIASVATSVPTLVQARDDAQLWTGGSATIKLGAKFRLSQDVTLRFSDNRNGLYEIESNTLLGFALSKNVAIWAGYNHDPQYSAGHFTVMEQRAREQVTFDNLVKIGGGTLSGRLRLEQRWRERLDGTGWRFRPYLKFALPLKSGSKTALVLSHESFIDLNTNSFQKVGGEERMRNLIAISTPIVKNVSAEIGYMNQHGFVRNGPDTQDHAASLMLNFSF